MSLASSELPRMGQGNVKAIVDPASETVVVAHADHLELIFSAVGVSLSFQDAEHMRAYLRHLEAMLDELAVRGTERGQ